MAKIKRILGQTIIYKIPHRKPNTEHNEPHYKPGWTNLPTIPEATTINYTIVNEKT